MAKFNEIINSDKPVLIDFSAEWCQPCKMMPPILKDVKRNVGDKVRIIKIDVDRNPAVAQKYGIRSVPTIMIFKNGQVLFNQAGVIPAQQLTEIVKKEV